MTSGKRKAYNLMITGLRGGRIAYIHVLCSGIKMSVLDSFDAIMLDSHWLNWAPDWQIAKDIYESFPDSYSVLTPFAYTYLEELIRTTTSEYGQVIFDSNGKEKQHIVGMDLIKLAIQENADQNPEFALCLEKLKKYYYNSKRTDEGDNRHSVAHGYMHPRYWSKESFDQLILDIANISKYGKF